MVVVESNLYVSIRLQTNSLSGGKTNHISSKEIPLHLYLPNDLDITMTLSLYFFLLQIGFPVSSNLHSDGQDAKTLESSFYKKKKLSLLNKLVKELFCSQNKIHKLNIR